MSVEKELNFLSVKHKIPHQERKIVFSLSTKTFPLPKNHNKTKTQTKTEEAKK